MDILSIVDPPSGLPEMPLRRIANLLAKSDIKSPPPDDLLVDPAFSSPSCLAFFSSIFNSLTDFRPALDDPPALRIASIRLARPPPPLSDTDGAVSFGASGMSSKGGGAIGGGGAAGGSSNLGIVVSSVKVIFHFIYVLSALKSS